MDGPSHPTLSWTFYPSAIWQKIPKHPQLDSPTASFLRCSPTPTWTNPNTHYHSTVSSHLHFKITPCLPNRQYYCAAMRLKLLLFYPIENSSVVQSNHMVCIYFAVYLLYIFHASHPVIYFALYVFLYTIILHCAAPWF